MEAWTDDGLRAPGPGGGTPLGLGAETDLSISGVPWLTLALLLGSALVLLAAGGISQGLSVESLLTFGAKATPLILDHGEAWRLLAANLLHKDALHFAFNAFAVWNVGGPLERAIRAADYVALIFATALATTLCSAIGADSISLGASGIAFGLLGAAAAFGWRRGVHGSLKAHFGLRLVPWLLALFAAGLGSAGVDNWGHAGGLAAGCVIGLFVSPRSDPPQYAQRRLAGVIGALLTVLSMGLFMGPALPVLGAARQGPQGLLARFPLGWRIADSGPDHLSFTNGLAGSFRGSATVFAAAAPESPALACHPVAGKACSCGKADALVRALVQSLPRLPDVGALRSVELVFAEPGAEAVVKLQGSVLGAGGQAVLAAVCRPSPGGPVAVVVLLPPRRSAAAARIASRMMQKMSAIPPR